LGSAGCGSSDRRVDWGNVYAPQVDLYLPGLILPTAFVWLLIYSAVRLAIRHERKARKD
jgi:hypothetical protein